MLADAAGLAHPWHMNGNRFEARRLRRRRGRL